MVAAATVLLFASCSTTKQEKRPTNLFYQPWESLGVLFHDVQTSGIFSDSKTFVDCDPKSDPAAILNDYLIEKDKEEFDLRIFVEENFIIPPDGNNDEFVTEKSFEDHLNGHWDYLTKSSASAPAFTTLLPLPNQYIVPGGRFREVYYWDSYFSMIGLAESGKVDLIGSMLDNFAFLIDTLGFIPNANRSYYLSRSQPPLFSSMVNIYIQSTSVDEGLKYLPAIQAEYNFWMKGADQLSEENPAVDRVVYFNGKVLNRYWDNNPIPRPESYKEDFELAEGLIEEQKVQIYRNLKAGAESGWDYSTRWFESPDDFGSIRVIEILPVDLNSIMYAMETSLWVLYEASGDMDNYRKYLKISEERYNAINELFWNEKDGMYQDVLWRTGDHTNQITLASFYPQYFKVARQDYAEIQVPVLLQNLLGDGGFMTTIHDSGQQWDYPNGWAPLQWISIKGLEHYGFEDQAKDVQSRWLNVNRKVYLNTGKMMEKYNVVDTTLLAGGGEYPNQDGFGWTNGVVQGLLSESPKY